jgi:hypothetical protein
MALLILFSFSACEAEEKTAEIKADNANTITVEDLKEYYNESLQGIPDDYLKGYLLTYPLTEKDLERANWDDVINKAYTDGNIFGCNVDDILAENQNEESIEQFLGKLNRVVVIVTMPANGELVHDTYSVLDFKKQKVYQFDDAGIRFEYTKAENIYDVSSNIQSYYKEISNVAYLIEDDGNNEVSFDYTFEIVLEDNNYTIKKYTNNGVGSDTANEIETFFEDYMMLDIEAGM